MTTHAMKLMYPGDLFHEPGAESEWFMVCATEDYGAKCTRVQRMDPEAPYIPRVVSEEFRGLAEAIARCKAEGGA